MVLKMYKVIEKHKCKLDAFVFTVTVYSGAPLIVLLLLLLFGFSIIRGYWSRRHFNAVCFPGFSAMLDVYMGGCQAALG